MCQIVINKMLLEIDVIVILIVVTVFLFVKGLRIHFTFNSRNFSRFTKATWAITYAHFFFLDVVRISKYLGIVVVIETVVRSLGRYHQRIKTILRNEEKSI